MKTTLISIFLPAILLISCYQPDGENFVDVRQPDAAGITIDLEKYGDTVFIDQNTLITFVLNGNSLLEQYEVVIDNALYRASTSSYGGMNVYLDAHDIGNGIHTMDFKVTLRTYSGSLADKFEAEKFLLTKPFVLVVDTEAPEPRLISMDTTRGTVDLSWDAYTKWNFQSYRIAKCKTSDPFESDCQYFDIKDPLQTQWTDSAFVGGRAAYRVQLRTSAHFVPGEAKSLYSKVGTVIESLPDRKLKLSWTRPHYHRNVQSVQVVAGGAEIKFTADLSDTIVISNDIYNFGGSYNTAFEIVLQGKTSNAVRRQTVGFAHGRLIDQHSWLSLRNVVYHKQMERYFVQSTRNQSPWLTVYDKDFNPLIENQYSIWQLTLSENGQWMYADFNWPSGKDKGFIYEIDPGGLDTTKTFSLWQTRNWIFSSRMDVSNTNLLAYQYTNGHALSEMPGGRVLAWRSVAGAGVALSSDGKYYFDYDRVSEVTGDVLTLVGTIAPASNPDYVFFRSDVPDELVILEAAVMRVIKIPDMTERTIPITWISRDHPVIYDPVSNSVLFKSGYSFLIVDLETDTSFIVPVTSDVYYLSMANGKLFSNNGYTADLALVKSFVE